MSMHPLHNYFKDYKGNCNVFVETGTNTGGGVTLAVMAGFQEIHTVDIKEQKDPSYKHGLKNIYYHIGDSSEVLRKILPTLKGKKIMFWLDAHSSLLPGDEESYPLVSELEVIKKSGVNNATILIDDFLYMSHPDVTGWSSEYIVSLIKSINKDYKIEYLSNPIMNNILIARV